MCSVEGIVKIHSGHHTGVTSRLCCWLQTVTALVFGQQSGALLLSGSQDTTVSTWLLMDVLDASLSQQAMQHQPPTPLHSWYAALILLSVA